MPFPNSCAVRADSTMDQSQNSPVNLQSEAHPCVSRRSSYRPENAWSQSAFYPVVHGHNSCRDHVFREPIHITGQQQACPFGDGVRLTGASPSGRNVFSTRVPSDCFRFLSQDRVTRFEKSGSALTLLLWGGAVARQEKVVEDLGNPWHQPALDYQVF